MIGAFGRLKSLVKVKYTKVVIDSGIFRLHYKLTFGVLVACCILGTMRQNFGDHIRCIQDGNGVPDNVLNNYCFISTTFSVPKTYGSKVGHETAYFGLGTYTDKDEIKYHAYYQWVPFVLFAQALMFYLPHALWKAWEASKISVIVQGMNAFTIREEATAKKKKEEILSDYIVNNLHEHNWWAIKYFTCEVLNLVNVIFQIYFTDYFLGGEFLRYGINVVKFLSMDPEVRFDPMSRVFPRVTKCTFHKFGSSGTIQRHDAMCVLALNVINEKIYTFLWFWFVTLAVITGISFIFRVLTIVYVPLRTAVIRSSVGRGGHDDADVFTQKAQIGDWVLLSLLSKNLDTMTFGSLLRNISKKLSYASSSNGGDDTPILT